MVNTTILMECVQQPTQNLKKSRGKNNACSVTMWTDQNWASRHSPSWLDLREQAQFNVMHVRNPWVRAGETGHRLVFNRLENFEIRSERIKNRYLLSFGSVWKETVCLKVRENDQDIGRTLVKTRIVIEIQRLAIKICLLVSLWVVRSVSDLNYTYCTVRHAVNLLDFKLTHYHRSRRAYPVTVSWSKASQTSEKYALGRWNMKYHGLLCRDISFSTFLTAYVRMPANPQKNSLAWAVISRDPSMGVRSRRAGKGIEMGDKTF